MQHFDPAAQQVPSKQTVPVHASPVVEPELVELSPEVLEPVSPEVVLPLPLVDPVSPPLVLEALALAPALVAPPLAPDVSSPPVELAPVPLVSPEVVVAAPPVEELAVEELAPVDEATELVPDAVDVAAALDEPAALEDDAAAAVVDPEEMAPADALGPTPVAEVVEEVVEPQARKMAEAITIPIRFDPFIRPAWIEGFKTVSPMKDDLTDDIVGVPARGVMQLILESVGLVLAQGKLLGSPR